MQSLRVLLKNLRGVERSLRARFGGVEHNNGRCGTGGGSAHHTCATEAARVSAHESVALVPAEIGIAAANNTGDL